MKSTAVLLIVLFAAFDAASAADGRPRIAIIIDDLGYHYSAGQRAIALPGPISYAILPGAPRATALARAVNANGKEVLLHLPMQAADETDYLEPVSVTLDMSREDLAATIDAAFDAVPHAIGVNNHRGSLITRHPGHMRWLMEEIRQREAVFFIDSYTTHRSVALQVAAETGINAMKRDVFLDADAEPDTIAREFERLKSIARRKGAAVAIGHPYQATLDFLELELPKLSEQGFRLVPISELVAN